MKNPKILTLAVLSAALSHSMLAQQGQTNSLGDFTMERIILLSGVSAPTPPNLPGQVLDALQSGALEMHQVFVYSSAQRIIDQTNYILPGGSPLPSTDLSKAIVGDHYKIQVDSIVVNQSRGPSALMIGRVVSNDMITPFGDITGAMVSLSFGYQGSGPGMRFATIIESVSPIYTIYSAAGVGSLSATASPQKCTLSTMSGSYQYSIRGSVMTAPNTFTPYVESGYLTADGIGNVAVFGTVNLGGNVMPNRLPLSYTINDNCSGVLKGKAGSLEMVLSSEGRRVNLMFTSPSNLIAVGDGQLQ